MEGMEGGFLPDKTEDVPGDVREDEAILLPVSLNRRCRHCMHIPIDEEIERTFGIDVCRDCRYRQLRFATKTSCMSNYLLTNEELGEFRFLVRPNPHKGTWSDMHLYLEDEVERFAVEKWGSLDAIRDMRERRCRMLEERKVRKLKARVRDLKRSTRIRVDAGERHVHEFVEDGDVSRCACGMAVEQEEM